MLLTSVLLRVVVVVAATTAVASARRNQLLESSPPTGADAAGDSSLSSSCRGGPCPCNAEGIHCAGLGLSDMPTGMRRGSATYLNFQENRLAILTSGALVGFSRLQRLRLSANYIELVEPGAFRHCKALLTLDIGHNRLEDLPPGALAPLRRLEHLNLADNRLSSVVGLFDGLKRLQSVSLRGNLLNGIERLAFAGCPALRFVDLSSNRLTAIAPDAFAGLRLLAYVVLSHNPSLGTAGFPADVPDRANVSLSTTHLLHVGMRNCGLTAVPRWLPPTLSDLDLANNRIAEIRSDDFIGMERLQSVDLASNMIANVGDGAFDDARRLTRLLLQSNRLRRVPAGLPSSIAHLSLERNAIDELSAAAFEGIDYLSELNLAHNVIHAAHRDAFASLRQLRRVQLENNSIQFVPRQLLSGLRMLRSLDLSDNPLSELENGCLDGLSSLDSLKISNTPANIKAVGPLIIGSPALRILDVSESPALASLVVNYDLTTYGLQNVRYLNLMRANLTSIGATFPQYLPRLETLLLGDNPWHCDRSLHWLQGWLRTGRDSASDGGVSFAHRDHLRCATPEELFGRSIGSLRPIEWTLRETKRANQGGGGGGMLNLLPSRPGREG